MNYNRHGDYDSSDDDQDINSRIPFFKREKGPRYKHLVTIKPSDPLFDRLMSYRYYRLMQRSHRRDADMMLDTQKRMNALSVSLSDVKFDGKDPALVFDFLTRFTESADLNRMSEAQAFIALPKYLSGIAEQQFRATRYGARSGGVSSWPEAVQYFLSTYATPSVIREAVNEVRNIRQHPNEDELQYSCRLNNAVYRCGNVFEEHDKMTFFINGLLPEIQPAVARRREEIPRRSLRYDHLVQYARDEGKSHRARSGGIRGNRTKRSPPQGSAHMLEQQEYDRQTDGSEQLFYIPDNSGSQSLATTDLPNTSDLDSRSSEQEDLLTMGTARPAKLSFGDWRTQKSRPGWQIKQQIICYQCYVVNKHM